MKKNIPSIVVASCFVLGTSLSQANSESESGQGRIFDKQSSTSGASRGAESPTKYSGSRSGGSGAGTVGSGDVREPSGVGAGPGGSAIEGSDSGSFGSDVSSSGRSGSKSESRGSVEW